jgi:hypothetical protein
LRLVLPRATAGTPFAFVLGYEWIDDRVQGSLERAMRTGTTKRMIRLLAAASMLFLMVGCQIPGSSFASDPLQLRFAEATKQSLAAAEKHETRRLAHPQRSAQAEPIVLAGHSR